MNEHKLKLKSLESEKDVIGRELETNSQKMSRILDNKTELENYIDKTVEQSKEVAKRINSNIELFESDLANIFENMNLEGKNSSMEKSKESVYSFLDEIIKKKEEELECPVCLDTAKSPICSCPESHLICSVCLPKLDKCPVCREKFGNPRKRHRYAEICRDMQRYAENIEDELHKLMKKRDSVHNIRIYLTILGHSIYNSID